jgi:hypothetical protein
MGVVDHQTGKRIAREWLDAFNAHRADRVVEHFAADVTATSPRIVALRPGSDGTLRGRAEVLSYYEEGLRRAPELHFTLIEVLCGVNQVTIVYRNEVGAMVAETLTLGEDGDVHAVNLTYGQRLRSPQS